jgi:putative phage-type endonuclease
MKVVTAEQGTEAWFSARCGVPSASRFSAVMAKGKGSEPSLTRKAYMEELAWEAVTGVKDSFEATPAMQHGVEQEPFARAMYETRTGLWVTETGFLLHDTISAGASPDGLVGDDGLLEIKCPQPKTHREYMELPKGQCPSAYRWQVMGQIWIAERDWCDFVSYLPSAPENCKLVVRRVYRDDLLVKNLETEVNRFNEELANEINYLKNYTDERTDPRTHQQAATA